ncbi:hypothetical protein MMC11_002925 [Xylographa trunciseda]|nr:hypothetical protein [Xylographa trunciseda]
MDVEQANDVGRPPSLGGDTVSLGPGRALHPVQKEQKNQLAEKPPIGIADSAPTHPNGNDLKIAVNNFITTDTGNHAQSPRPNPRRCKTTSDNASTPDQSARFRKV